MRIGRLRFALSTLLLTLSLSAEAQPPSKIPRIGYLSGRDTSSPGPLVAAFRKGLRDLGYIEGKNIIVEYRFSAAKREAFQGFVAELISLNVDALVVPIQVMTAKRLVKTTPIVMIASFDPVTTGVIDSLARPGGNITGFTTLSRELSGKRLDLLKEVAPRLVRIGVLRNTDEPSNSVSIKEFKTAAQALKLELQPLEVRGANPDLEGAFKEAAKAHINALMIFTPFLLGQQRRIADLAIKEGLPTMFEGGTWVEAGGLMSYSADEPDVFRRAATYVDKILKGAKPAELPIQQPTKFEMVINLKTAKQIGVTIPPNVLARADRVIR